DRDDHADVWVFRRMRDAGRDDRLAARRAERRVHERFARGAPRSMTSKIIFLLVIMLPLVAGCLSFHTGPMPGEPKNATFANVSGVRVRYVDRGDRNAPVVVLLHGFASS